MSGWGLPTSWLTQFLKLLFRIKGKNCHPQSYLSNLCVSVLIITQKEFSASIMTRSIMNITNFFLIKFPVLSIRHNSYLYCKPSEKYIDKNVIAPNYFIVLFSKVVIIQGTNFLLSHYVYHYRIVQVSSFVRVLSLFLQSIAVTQEIQNWLKNREPMIV